MHVCVLNDVYIFIAFRFCAQLISATNCCGKFLSLILVFHKKGLFVKIIKLVVH